MSKSDPFYCNVYLVDSYAVGSTFLDYDMFSILLPYTTDSTDVTEVQTFTELLCSGSIAIFIQSPIFEA